MKKRNKVSESSDGSASDNQEPSPSKVKGMGSKRGPKPQDPRWTRVV